MTHTKQKACIKRKIHKTGIMLFGLRFESEALQQVLLEGQAKEASVLPPLNDLRTVRVKAVGSPVLELTTMTIDGFDEPVSLGEWKSMLTLLTTRFSHDA
ncbi:hypothetical protein GFM09_34540 [Rhizobium leguminosarum bv. viciae]|uniref:hypothetical protein n=1 Tax=Rhizobium leguminosarum TaxID=384 RepID=UPI0014428F1B|nr:hypothetical protein [Rhizobium leguminosarum]NKL74261.1 hypothetical protein [Rhizobium leguminosarum bv. viciae]